jgi:hypothetical protein
MSTIEGPGPATDVGSHAMATDALVGHPDLLRLASRLQAPQDAIRARLNAVALDLILLGFASQLLAGTRSGSTSAATRAAMFWRWSSPTSSSASSKAARRSASGLSMFA